MLVQSTGIQSYNNFVQPQNSIKIIKAEVKNYENTKLQSYPNNYYMPIAFGSRKKTNEEIIKNIGEENFPNSQILKKFRTQKDKSLYEIHREHYADLLKCKTLYEAKELYPEFESVLDAKDIDINTLDKRSVLYKIAQGQKGDANIETLSLTLLKKYYAEVNSKKDKKNYWGLDLTSLNNLFEQLKIKIINRQYMNFVVNSNPQIVETISQARTAYAKSEKGRQQFEEQGKAMSEFFKTEEGQQEIERRAQKHREFNQTEEGKKIRIEAGRKHREFNQTEEGKKRLEETGKKIRETLQSQEGQKSIAEGIEKRREFYKTEEGKKSKVEQAQKYHEFAQTEEGRKIINLKALSCKLAWHLNPEIRDNMSEIAKEYPGFVRLFIKKENGIITDEENQVLLGYFKDCEYAMPKHKKEITGPINSLIDKDIKERMQKVKDKTETDEDLTILSSYYILTKAQAPEYLDCFAEVEDTLLENEDTFNEAVNMMSDYYKYIQEKYPKEIVEKYFSRLQEVLKSSRELKVC